MPDFLDEKRQEITARLKELKPLVDEYSQLQAAAGALDGVGTTSPSRRSAAPAAGSRRRPGRPRGSKSAAATATATKTKAKAKGKRKAGRRKGGGIRTAEALAFVKEKPGVTMPELAEQMGIQSSYLYRLLPSLEEEGKVEKKGRGWHSIDAT